jgi:serine/threonine-protein kinase
LFFLFSANSYFIQRLESEAYDMGLRATLRIPSDKVAVIAIDERSIANLGRFPWHRSVHADMLDLLSASHAKIIGEAVLFLEPEVDPGMDYLRRISLMLDSPTIKTGAAAQQAELMQVRDLVAEGINQLDNDKKLSNSIAKANNVMLPMLFGLGKPLGKEDQPLPDYVLKNNLTNVKGAAEGMTTSQNWAAAQ